MHRRRQRHWQQQQLILIADARMFVCQEQIIVMFIRYKIYDVNTLACQTTNKI